MKTSQKAKIGVMAALFVVIYYYLSLPALNIHSSETWFFIFFIVFAVLAGYVMRKRVNIRQYREFRHDKVLRTILMVLLVLVLVYGIGSLLSSPVVNAKRYQQLMTVEEGTFTEDVQEISFNKIPLLDRDTATILGDRKMGSMVDMVSQFEADDIYSQINYRERPVRVTPLVYASFIKWVTNQKGGVPAYIRIDMASQNTELVKLSEGIRYSRGEYFNRYIYRHLRFHYPTYIFGQLSFEIDDEGVPYWVAPVKKFNIGLFGGETVGRVVLCNAITGECEDYLIDEVPEWIDRAYSADLLVELFDYYGTLKHGFFNSILGQRDCLCTTSGYNYLALDDDVWMYTGVTSVNGDQSNVGFVLSNQRTMETKYYKVEGATEDAAMDSAEGQVQNLHYKATFPLLLNIQDEPTYFIALKDDAGLVKKYALVNVQKYQIVAIGDTVNQCQDNYLTLLYTNGVKKAAEDTREVQKVTGEIAKIAQAVIDGNSHYYIMVVGNEAIFDVSVADFVEIIKYSKGDTITLEYKEGDKTNTVVALE